MNRILYLVIIGLILIGCSSSETKKSNDLQIRISNVSEFNYDNIKVSTTGEMVDFGNLNSNSKSDYKTFDKAYKYAYVEFQINGKTFILQPIDYFGETLLENGKYAYELNVNIDAQRVLLELKNE
jgi:predicted component of type VI protein secretion system|tara:strand:- start:56 stop:430 length:375 start_codon:yes stop_codon:yes gene_type:complete